MFPGFILFELLTRLSGRNTIIKAMSGPGSLPRTSAYSPPPSYNDTSSSHAAHSNTPPSERTPLIYPTQKGFLRRRKTNLLFLVIIFIVLAAIPMICGVYLRENIASERRQFEQELIGRRMEEKSRIRKWELTFNATQERHRRQMEKWQQEEEEMQRLGLHWDEPTRHPNCAGYSTREYWARLLNTVPYDYNWAKACEDIPLVIHGRSVKTFRCYTNPYVSGEVYGHWLVDFNEPFCSPFWNDLQDKGCTAEGSGHRRFQAHLVNFHDSEDGEKLCASTPIDFHGKHLDSPKTCVNWGSTKIYGFWEIEDSDC